MSNKIPAELLHIVENHDWKPTGGYSSFDDVFRERAADPSFYHLRRDDEAEGVSAFSYKEIELIARTGLLNRLVKHHDAGVALNEHAAHALSDFLAETVDAFVKLKGRLQEAREATGSPR